MKIWKIIVLVLVMLTLTPNVSVALPANTAISNTSVVKYVLESESGNSPTSTEVITQSTATINSISPSVVTLFVGTARPSTMSGSIVSPSFCGGSFKNNPDFNNQSDFLLPQQVAFTELTTLKSSDPLFIKITDQNRNTNPLVIDSLNVTLTTDGGDSESLTIYETGINTSDFIGYMQTRRNAVVVNSCELSVQSNQKITVSYLDVSNQNTVMSTSILVDPLGVVFDTSTGLPVSGATVTLINNATNMPAQVFGDDGISIYPNTVITGMTVTDSGGTVYNYNAGEFRFPLVSPGVYRLSVVPPSGYTFPSTMSDADLQSNFGTTYVIVPGASKGGTFPVIASIVQVDIPIDAGSGQLLVTKSGSSSIAGIGDFIQYSISVQNSGNNGLSNIVFADSLPKGFKYQNKSFVVNGVKVNPTYDGKTISFNLGTLNSKQSASIKYVTEITVSSALGKVTNFASASAGVVKSNTAQFTTTVRDDLLRDKSIIVGTVYDTVDCNPKNFKRLSDVKILFETGAYVISDKEGLWHIDSLQPITHVAKIDKSSLPVGYEPILCEDTTQFAQKPDLRFVDATPGSIKRVDFYVKRVKLVNKNNELVKELSLDDLLQTKPVVTEIVNKLTAESIKIDSSKAGTAALSYNDIYMNAMVEGEEKLLFPNDKFAPQVMAIGVAYQHKSENTIKLYINGTEADGYSYDGLRENSAKTMAITYWRGIPIKEGKNLLFIKLINKDGKVVKEDKKEINFSNIISQAIFVPSESKLMADGKSAIEVAIRMIDEYGNPAHVGMSGVYSLDGAFIPFVDRANGIPLELVNNIRDNQKIFVVGADGIAKIKLQPTSQGGEAVIKIKLRNKESIIRPWISTARTEWVLVGIAEGTVAYNKIKNHINNDVKGIELIEGNDGRVAFYGRGTIKNDFLLTLAYDNKRTAQTSPINQVGGDIQAEVYQIYGDTTISKRDAATSKKIYIRIEKEKFYAMFGDIQTNFTIADLTRYQRNITGFKSEFKGDKFSYSMFAAKTSAVLEREETLSDGTTGFYRVKSTILPYSETVSIVLRDKNQRDRILNTVSLVRFIDYDIDYDLGTVRLLNPVPVFDTNFNPNFIRIEYGVDTGVEDNLLLGGRVAYKINETTEIGVNSVSEEGKTDKANMTSIDLQHESKNNRLKAEIASSKKSVTGIKTEGSAYNVEYQYQNEKGSATIYAKKVDKDYGVISNLPNDTGIKKEGIDVRLRLEKDINLNLQAVRQEDLTNQSKSVTVEARLEKQFNENLSGYVGIRQQNNEIKDTATQVAQNVNTSTLEDSKLSNNYQNRLYTFGSQYKFNEIPLRVNSQVEQSQQSNNIVPSRYKINLEYDINNKITVAADRETVKYKDFSFDFNKIGVKLNPWSGGRIQLYTGQTVTDESNAFYQIGIDQNIKFDHWVLDGSMSRQQWNKDIPINTIPAGAIVNFDNFNVYQLGATYRNEPFVYQTRWEYRTGDNEDKKFVRNDIFKKLDGGYALSVGHEYQSLVQKTSSTEGNLLRAGVSYRGLDNKNTVFSRIEYVDGEINGQKNNKVILNAHYNYKPNYNWEFTNHVGYKYNIATFDSDEYSGSSYVLNSGFRYFINNKWDVGMSGLYAASTNSNVKSMGSSMSVGYSAVKNTWVSLGYQYIKDYDNNFNYDDSYIRGFFVKFRFKFDEETFHLNRASVQ